jgi:hypothetical protein
MVAVAFGVVFSFAMISVVQWHKRYSWLNRKPFNCSVCLSGWAALVAYFLPISILYPLITFFAAVFITSMINKWRSWE